MKIGLVLFGHLRSYRDTYTSFVNLKKALEQAGTVDVFCHAWDIEESLTASWWKEHSSSASEQPHNTIDEQEIITRYQPANYLVEPSRNFDDSGYRVKNSVSLPGILSMLYSQKRAFELLQEYEKRENFLYDVVVKTRYDLLYEIAPGFSTLPEQSINMQCLFLPTSNPYELAGAYSDVFALGPRHLVKKYFEFEDEFREALDIYQSMGITQLIPELCMSIYLQKKGICINDLINLRIHILRRNGEKFQINSEKNFSNNDPLCFHRKTKENIKNRLPAQSDIIESNGSKLAKKYMAWIDTAADETTLSQYSEFYSGRWMPLKKISVLATKGKRNNVFVQTIMRDFFEGAFWAANYGYFRRFLLAAVLTGKRVYGYFFFRILAKQILGK